MEETRVQHSGEIPKIKGREFGRVINLPSPFNPSVWKYMELVAHEALSSSRSQSHRTEGGTCFHCQQQGHWARACPYRSPKAKPLSIDSPDFPHIQCRCGAGTCVIRTSRTPRNPGRKFYSCPAKMGGNCDFFKWCDTVTDHEISKSPQSPPPPSSIPMCPCGAGICRISMETIGPNAGRTSFVCPVKKVCHAQF